MHGIVMMMTIIVVHSAALMFMWRWVLLVVILIAHCVAYQVLLCTTKRNSVLKLIDVIDNEGSRLPPHN